MAEKPNIQATMIPALAACENFGGLAVCRFFLGCFEAPITPAFMLIVSMWYARDQQPFRAGCFYCCNGVGSMVRKLLWFSKFLLTSPDWRHFMLWYRTDRQFPCLQEHLPDLWRRDIPLRPSFPVADARQPNPSQGFHLGRKSSIVGCWEEEPDCMPFCL